MKQIKQMTTGPFGMGIVYDYNNIIKTDSSIINNQEKINNKCQKTSKGYKRPMTKKLTHK